MGTRVPDPTIDELDTTTLLVGRAGPVVVIGEGEAARQTLERLFGAGQFQVVTTLISAWLSHVLESLSGEVDLVVLEVSRKLDASSIVAAIRRAYPCARVVLCLSPEAAPGVGAALSAGALAVIMKPFDPRHLNGLMRLVLDRQPHGCRVRPRSTC